MKKIIIAALLSLISTQAMAAGNDWRYTRRDPTNVVNVLYDIPTPPSSAFLVIDITSGVATPKHILFGSGLSYNGTTMSVSGVPAANVSGLATVATSGAYSDLSGLPSIPAAQVQGDWLEATTSAADYIKNKPTLSTVSASGAYNDLIGKPSFATVATTGAYSDLSGKPTLSTVAITGSYSDLTGTPSLATVATTGSYSDLTGKPSIPAAQVNSDWTASSGVAQILNKPSLSTVATTGAYSDLTGKPTIPAAASGSKVARAVNSCFQVSSSQNAMVSYSVDVAATLSLTTGQTGTVFLKTFSNSSCTTAANEIDSGQNANTGTLAIGLGLTQTVTVKVNGWVPAGTWVEIIPTQTTGTPTFAYRNGSEVLF